MEIEIPRRMVWYVLSVMLAVTPLLIGMLISPYSEDKRPLILTPRLAKINQYRKDVRAWAKSLQGIDLNLQTLLDEIPGDLFDQNYQVDQVYQKSRQLSDVIDQSAIPPTFEAFHQELGDTVTAYLDASNLASTWVSEPEEENLQAAKTALSTAHELLNRLYVNPWIEVTP